MALEHFADTHSTKEDGRYEVKLPRVQDPPELGNSQNSHQEVPPERTFPEKEMITGPI